MVDSAVVVWVVVSAFWIYVWRHCVGCGSRFWVSWVGVLGWWLVEFGH